MGGTIECLLIDDDTDDQEIFTMAIHDVDESISCTCVNNYEEAFEKLNMDESFIPHFIFIDMNIPKVNGIDCLRAIKNINRLKHIPVYMYSTSADPTIVSECKESGATDFIIKPATIREFANLLRDLLINQ